MNKKDIKKNLLPYVFLLVFFIGCLVAFKMFNNTVNELTYDEFLQDLNGGKITELTITPKVRTDTYKLTGKLDEYKDNEYFILYIPQSEEFISKITAAKEGTGSFKLTIINDPEASIHNIRWTSNLGIHKTTRWWKQIYGLWKIKS